MTKQEKDATLLAKMKKAKRALLTVVELAEQNILDERDCDDAVMRRERLRQLRDCERWREIMDLLNEPVKGKP